MIMKKDDIKFIFTEGPYGDDTSQYDLEFSIPLKVSDFIGYIKEFLPKEFGFIYFDYYTGDNKKPYPYKCGRFEYDIPSEIMERNVEKIRGSGGWGSMDYYVYLFPESDIKPAEGEPAYDLISKDNCMDLYNIYSQIERCESIMEDLDKFIKENDGNIPEIFDKSYTQYGSVQIQIPYFEKGKFKDGGARIFNIQYDMALAVLKEHVRFLKEKARELNNEILKKVNHEENNV